MRRRSSGAKSSQPAISRIVRAQPRQKPLAGSMMQTPMHGESGALVTRKI